MGKTMRDTFWDSIYDMAKTNRDIVIVSADFGAPSLDKFRRDFPEQYINVGISEQNAVLVATGLALAGKKPIVYAITQFITLRCFEQIRIYPCGMNLPITILGVGAGISYWESGATHHCMEQLSIMRTLPNLKIINCSDEAMAQNAASCVVNMNAPKFIQLDREIILSMKGENIDFDKGFRMIVNGDNQLVIATGIMNRELLDIRKDNDYKFSLMDLYTIPVDKVAFKEVIAKFSSVITVEENTKQGGMGSYIMELLSEFDIQIPVKQIALETANGYEPSYNYGGRENIREAYGMGKQRIKNVIEKMYERQEKSI